ncbi:MAG: protein BatD [bacterium]|nr:protein BatD [bacterium]
MRYPARVMLLAIACLSLAAAANAQGIRVTVDRAEATIQDKLTLRLTVDGSQNAQPRLPDLSAFQVYQAGQQSQVNMAGGRTSVAITYNYFLVPRQTGTFTIGPASVEIGGKVYESRPFSIRILEASATPRESEDLFIRAAVSNKSPYVGEQVIYTWRFFRRVRAEDAQLLTPLQFDGFLAEDLGDVREYRSTRGGQEYLVSEIRKALFPQEAGKLTLPATQLRCQVLMRSRGRRGGFFDDFFNRTTAEARVLNSPPIEIEVRPRPAAPRGFSGLIGNFELAGRISKRQLRVGESATWKLTVSGSGNVQMIGEPNLPDLSRFKIYDDKPKSSIERTGSKLTGSRAYSKALVPLEAGEQTVPAVSLIYFDPESGSYQTASTSPVTLSVTPSEGKEDLRLTESVAPTTGKVAVRILADDILPIYKDLDAVASTPFGHRVDAAWLGGLLSPPLLFFGLLLVERRRHHLETNVDQVRRRSALRKALKELGEVENAARRGSHAEAAQLASRVLRQYVGDKVALEGSAFTPAEVAAQLGRCGVDDELVSAARERLEKLEVAQYGGAGAEESEALAAELRELLKHLDRQIRL